MYFFMPPIIVFTPDTCLLIFFHVELKGVGFKKHFLPIANKKRFMKEKNKTLGTRQNVNHWLTSRSPVPRIWIMNFFAAGSESYHFPSPVPVRTEAQPKPDSYKVKSQKFELDPGPDQL